MFVNAGSAAAANLISTEYMHMSSVAPYYPTLMKKQTNILSHINEKTNKQSEGDRKRWCCLRDPCQ
jgi:hypothetical protein